MEEKLKQTVFYRLSCNSFHIQEWRLRLIQTSNRFFKCQRQLWSDFLIVPGLKIVVRLEEQGERSCPPDAQKEIDSSKRFWLKLATPLLPPLALAQAFLDFHAAVHWEASCFLLHLSLSSQGSVGHWRSMSWEAMCSVEPPKSCLPGHVFTLLSPTFPICVMRWWPPFSQVSLRVKWNSPWKSICCILGTQ